MRKLTWFLFLRTVYHTLKGIIKAKYGQDACNVGDEGGFAPNVQDNREGLLLLMDAIEKAGYTGKVGDIDFHYIFVCSAYFAYAICGQTMQIKIGMDVAASEFLTKDGKYDLDFKKHPNDGAHVHSAQSLCELYKDFVKEFPIVSIEDPFDQDDWSSWASLQSSVDIQIVGDDLLVTNPKRIAEAIQKKACNGLLLKANIFPLSPFFIGRHLNDGVRILHFFFYFLTPFLFAKFRYVFSELSPFSSLSSSFPL